MNYRKVIKFRYFQIFEESESGGKKLFDFSQWLLLLKRKALLQKSIEFYEVKARVEKIEYDKKNNISAIRLMKLRDINIPAKAKDGKDAEVIHLEDDEYITEDVTMLYDDFSHILMLQSNRFSLNESKICEFIKYTSDYTTKSVTLEPILDEGREALKTGAYKTLEISFANMMYLTEARIGKSPLSAIIHPLRDLGGVAGKVSISLGHSKIDTLNRNATKKIIGNLKENEKFIRSAKIKVKSDESEAEIIDLFDNITNDYLEFTLASREALALKTMFSGMEKRFLQRKAEFYRKLKIPEG